MSIVEPAARVKSTIDDLAVALSLSVAPLATVTGRATETPPASASVPESTFNAAVEVWLRATVSVPEPIFVTAPLPPRLALSAAELSCVSMTRPSAPTVIHLSSSV